MTPAKEKSIEIEKLINASLEINKDLGNAIGNTARTELSMVQVKLKEAMFWNTYAGDIIDEEIK